MMIQATTILMMMMMIGTSFWIQGNGNTVTQNRKGDHDGDKTTVSPLQCDEGKKRCCQKELDEKNLDIVHVIFDINTDFAT